MNKVLLWANGLLVGLVVVLGLFLQSQGRLGAQSNFSGPLNSDAGYLESGVTIVDTNRNASFSGELNVSSTATFQATSSFRQALQFANCGTALYTLVALQERGAATSSAWVASTSITVSGAPADGVAMASFATTSVPNVDVTAKFQSANTATVFFANYGATNIAARTSSATVSVCFVDPI